jgi:hypothetical protein
LLGDPRAAQRCGSDGLARCGRRGHRLAIRRCREKHHFLNPVPIRLIHDRWIDKYTEPRVSALAELKSTLEEEGA